MKWTIVDSHGQDVVLGLLVTGRDDFIPGKLQQCSSGLTQAAVYPPNYPAPDAFRQADLSAAFFSPTRGHLDNPEGS